jgi:excisionase family DNA binding protein
MDKLVRLLTTDEVSDLFGISREALWRYVRMDVIPHIRIGHLIRFVEKDLLDWIRDGGCGIARAV